MEHPFRLAVLLGDRTDRIAGHGIGMRGVHDVADAGGDGGVDRGAVLRDTATDGVGTDQQHPTAAGEGLPQRAGFVEIAVADVGPTGGELPESLRMTADENQFRRREPLHQALGDHAPELARRSCDDDAHGISSLRDGGVPARGHAKPS